MPTAVAIKAVVERARSKAVWDGFYGSLLLAGLALLVLIGAPCSSAADPPAYNAIRVYDGDTILVQGSSGRETIRLLGIDAPETSKGKGKPGQPYSRKSQHYLAGLVLNRLVNLKVYGRDRYDRILAVVYCGGRDVNCAMLAAGLAEVYRGRTPEAFDKAPYLEIEAQARRSKIGMWRQGAAYVSPIRWKHPR